MNDNMDFRADLHCHSTCSDGTSTPKEVIDLAKEIGLQGLSITDHDTVDAYAEALPYAKKVGLEIISGAEFSSFFRGESVHILGYGFTLSNPALLEFCQKHRERRIRRYHAILERLKQHQMPISEEELLELEPQGSIGRPHIAMAMVKKGYVSSIEQAFKRYIATGKPCYVPGEAFSVEETLEIIHGAGGVAMIAHPHLIKNTRIIRDLLEMPFDGLEGYYQRIPHQDEKKWIQIAEHRDWIITGGSDYHGTVKPKALLGSSWVNKETFYRLQSLFIKNNPKY